ncbi:two component transcriptional regulator, LuxR family [Oscillochloris trichoides DG-6]|uniref:histidine kinase n=1 Tax=Oscillochloris trichoides DG-6 TaxID=765420 RepID=E1IDV8_9CHLR|nr:response regulator [Oscillochloris trichoides]EFO80627.1 two component transcriptional regulator, LuxR family [Oscillochloris trichoides DG-6]
MLATQDLLIERRPLAADVIALAALFWLIVMIVRQIRRIQHHSGQFISEAVLLGLLLFPSMLATFAYTAGWISFAQHLFVRDSAILLTTPLMVLVFLDLLPESVTLLVRLLGLALVLVVIAVSAAALLIGPLLDNQELLSNAMLRLIGLAAIGMALVLIGVPLLLRRSVLRPLDAVLEGVRQVNAGNLSVTVPVTFDDEIGLLTTSFNRMVDELRGTVAQLEQRVQERTAELARSEARHRELVEQIDEVIFRITMPAARVEYVSPSVERMLGYPAAAVLAHPLLMGDLLHPDELDRAIERVAKLSAGIVAPLEEYRVIDASGNERWIQQSNTGIYAAGQLVAVEGVCRDVTESRQAEARLLAQQRDLATLRERERIRRDLHDGLGQVLGYVNLQAQTAGDLAAAGQVAQARTIMTRLAQVAQDAHADIRRFILDLRVPVAQEHGEEWVVMLRRALHGFEQNYGLAVQLSCPPSLPAEPFTPAVGQEVLQIVIEALNNIQKHAGVAVAQVVIQHTPDNVALIVADNGGGFVPGAAERIQSDQSQTASFGLRIMAERAALIGASLRIDSAPGAGSQVVLNVPLRVAVLDAVRGEPSDDLLQQMRVLLADDHPLFREGMQTMLAARGVQVVGAAHDGLEAQELARRLRPDIILMDMQMPRCDGLDATLAIKAELPDTKILMLTVSADEENLLAAVKAGASGYLLKSLDSDAFFQMLGEAMRGKVVFSSGLAAQTLGDFAKPPAASDTTGNRLLHLSVRQYDILERVAAGATYKEIASTLCISEATVKYHMGQIVGLLQVSGRREAIALVRKATQ